MPEIFRFASLSSTMTEAAALAARGYPHGTAVVADTQTTGIGRHGHSWHSEPEVGLYVSIILRMPETSPVLTLALGLAAVEAIRNATGLICDLRWPNDVLVGERKVAGIMAQMSDSAAIAGIGINVNHMEFPAELAAVATSLRLAGGRSYDREPLLRALLVAVDASCEILRERGRAPILSMFRDASSYAAGRHVKVHLGERTIEGMTAGLDDAGFLLVRTKDRGIETVLAGGVRPA